MEPRAQLARRRSVCPSARSLPAAQSIASGGPIGVIFWSCLWMIDCAAWSRLAGWRAPAGQLPEPSGVLWAELGWLVATLESWSASGEPSGRQHNCLMTPAAAAAAATTTTTAPPPNPLAAPSRGLCRCSLTHKLKPIGSRVAARSAREPIGRFLLGQPPEQQQRRAVRNGSGRRRSVSCADKGCKVSQ